MSDPDRFLSALGSELTRAGIRGSRRRRILAEFADHLGCDADAHLGDPVALAAQFADELGTDAARSAALTAFCALAVSAIAMAVRVVGFGSLAAASGQGLGGVGLLVCFVAAQVAFVSGGLGLLRALLVGGRAAIPRAEAAILVRRAGIGLAAGAVATVALPLRATSELGHGPGSAGLSVVAMVVGLGAIALATPAVTQAIRVHPVSEGAAGDLFTDFGPLRPLATHLSRHSINRLALLSALGLAVVLALAGVVSDDPYDGIIRGICEGALFLAGYATLGGYLGIRPSN